VHTPTAVHNRTTAKTTEFMKEFGHEGPFVGCETAEDFVAALERPRRIIVIGARRGAVLRCGVKPAEEVGVDLGEVDREDRVSLRRQKLSSRRVGTARSGSTPTGLGIAQTGGGGDRMTESRCCREPFRSPPGVAVAGAQPIRLQCPDAGTWCWRRRRTGRKTAQAYRLRGRGRTYDADRRVVVTDRRGRRTFAARSHREAGPEDDTTWIVSPGKLDPT
jgi:hypothetical protein